MANSHMERGQISLIVKEGKSKPQWNITSFPVKMPIIKGQQITSVGEDVKKREPSYTGDRNVNWY